MPGYWIWKFEQVNSNQWSKFMSDFQSCKRTSGCCEWKMLQNVTLEEPPYWLFYLHDTQKLHSVTGLPEQCSGGTIRMYEKPRFEERQLAPIYLRPVTFALRAPEGTLRRRHYTLLLHGVCYILLKGRFCTHGNGVLPLGNFDSIESLPLLQSQS